METEWPEDHLVFHIAKTTQSGSDLRLSVFGRIWMRWMSQIWNEHVDHLWRRS